MVRIWLQLGLVTALILTQASLALAARYYIYQLADGSRMISDHRITKPGYKLVISRNKLKGTGRIAAKNITYHKPEHVDRWNDLIIQLAHRHKVDVALVKAVIHAESYFNYRAVSHAGAEGLMQLMPKTAARYGVNDPQNPYENLDAGIQYLSDLLKKYNWNTRYALAAYNAGEKAVSEYKGVPPYKETRAYVKKVLAYQELYRQVN